MDILRELQPFAGCEWTGLLREISNPDKHRFVPQISSDGDFRNTVYDPATGTITGTLAMSIRFEHRRELNVVVGVSRIKRETANVVASFVPAFIRSP